MSARAVVTIRQLGQAVRSCDTFNHKVSIPNMEHVLEIALKKLALAAPIRVDLGNSHYLIVEVAA